MRVCLSVCLLTLAYIAGACHMVTPDQGGGVQKNGEGMEMDMSGGSMAADALDAQATENGLFVVSAVSRLDPVVINETHAWTIHVEDAAGNVITDAEISVDGGMPAHDHGFPTAPRVTENLGGGDYLLEGMRFNMGGGWALTLEISSGGASDSVSFAFELN